jgi:CelD/BcsL family acetyltransferase involved in cellulose biosynthesis
MSAIAEFLLTEAPPWDVLELSGICEDDASVAELVAQLAERGCSNSDRRTAFRCWQLGLPASWEEYLAMLSKSHRMQLRRLQKRVLDARRAVVQRVGDEAELDFAWSILVDLHQKRRLSLGEPGCFASHRFAGFHQGVARQLLADGQLALAWVELAGRPVAAEYNLLGARTTYSYQGGVDPDFLDEQPGRLATLRTMQWAIEAGHTTFDFLRGDEPYKAHWRAQPVDRFTVRVVAERPLAQLREAAYQAVGSLKGWLRTGLQRMRETAEGACSS